MLSDKDIAKLCHGRLIYANMMNSAGTDAAGPHNAVILNSDEEIADNDVFNVVAISNNKSIDPTYLVPVPPRVGLKGNVICSWLEQAHLAGIIRVLPHKFLIPEMIDIFRMIRKFKDDNG